MLILVRLHIIISSSFPKKCNSFSEINYYLSENINKVSIRFFNDREVRAVGDDENALNMAVSLLFNLLKAAIRPIYFAA